MTTPNTSARLLSIVLAVASIAVLPVTGYAAERIPARGAASHGVTVRGPHAAREIVVRYRAGWPSLVRQMSRFAVTGELEKRLPLRGAEVVKVAKGTDLGAAIEVLRQRPEVLYAEPNYVYSAADVPNDPLVADEWALGDSTETRGIDAAGAWDVTTGSKDVVVAIADSGVAYDHPDLIDNMWVNRGEAGRGKRSNGIDDDHNGYVDDWRGWDWVGRDNNPSDLLGHGTHVAGTIGARGNNSIGVAGVNWNVSLMPLRILELDGTGTAADLASAFIYARRNGADVVNASLGGPHYSRTLADSVSGSRSTLFVVAAGNEGNDLDRKPNYPCSFPSANVLCVGASNEAGRMVDFSNYGDQTVDIAAPGTNILSTTPHVVTVFKEDFETDPGARWDTGGSRDSWASDEDSFGAYMTDSPSGRYRNSTNSWLETRSAIDLPSATACGLDFALRIETEPKQDGMLVETSPNGAHWKPLIGYTGNSKGWKAVTSDLAGGSDVFLRFRMITDRAGTGDGVRIDNIRVLCATKSYGTFDYREMSGTSMSAPIASGAAALLLSIAPKATPKQLEHALIAGSTKATALDGKVASGGRLNLVGAMSVLSQDLQLPDPPDLPDVPDLPDPDVPDLPGAEPNPTDSPSPTATPTPTPTETPSASPTPTSTPTLPPAETMFARRVSLQLKGSLVATGSVTGEGPTGCFIGVPVNIQRNGVVLRRLETADDGSFRVRLRPRKGRYRAVAPAVGLTDGSACVAASSASHQRRPRKDSENRHDTPGRTLRMSIL
ncbi:MAG: hypothetical protein QOK47_1235 [Actinomycetota bacterium]|nr:hypothetical protein [Actinomycetota bacterium]